MIRRIHPIFRTHAGTSWLLYSAVIGIALLGAATACQSNDVDKPVAEIQQAQKLIPISNAEAITARDTALIYLSEKAWGFFGATCDRWVELDYEFDVDDSGKSENGATIVKFNRRPDRDLGSPTLTFRVSPDGSVHGDNELARSGIAEGCDKW